MLTTFRYSSRGTAVEPYWLERDFHLENGDINYTIKVVQIHEREKDLREGRFARFVLDPQKYTIPMAVPAARAATEQKIEWIAENAIGAWSLDVESDHASHARLLYSFAVCRDACVFRLTFGLNVGLPH